MPDAVWTFPLPLVSARLRLREHRAGDLDDLLVFHGDEEVTRHTPWPVRDREQTREALTRRLGQREAAADGEAVVLAVEEAGEEAGGGPVIGEVLLLRRGEDEAVLGYALRRDRWGRGLATEAAGTLVDAGFGLLGLRRVSAVVVPANTASAVVLRKLGFTPTTADPATGDPATAGLATFDLTAERWRARRGTGGAAGGPGA